VCTSFIAYRDKKVVGVFVRFSCTPLHGLIRDTIVVLKFTVVLQNSGSSASPSLVLT
jgi:hypothetical protein